MTVQGSTLNPSDIATGSGTFAPTLTNGNLTMTTISGSGGVCAIRSTGGNSTGSFYYEVTVGGTSQNANPGIGFVLAGQSLLAFATRYTGNLPQATGGFLWLADGTLFFNDTQTVAGNWQPWQIGDVLGLFVNVATGEAWGRVNGGLWNNVTNASPAQGIGGFNFSALGAGQINPVLWSEYSGGAQTQFTANFSFPDNQTPADPTSLLIWARTITKSGVVIGASNWSNRFSAIFQGTPAPAFGGGNGGMPFQGASIQPGFPPKLYLTGCGTGDAGIHLRSQPPFLAIPPAGFAWGWPNGFGTTGDQWDVTTALGSATVSGYFDVSFPSFPGLIQGRTGVSEGSYYFEYDVNYDSFSEKTGVGIARHGCDLTFLSSGGFSSNDPNGGACLDGGNVTNSFQPTIFCNEGPGLAVPLPAAPSGATIGVAVTLAPFTPALFNPQFLQPVPLVCIPCSELLLNLKGR